MSALEVRPISGALGPRCPATSAVAWTTRRSARSVGRCWTTGDLLRDQRFDAEQQKALARRFGDIFVHPNYAGTQADPEFILIRRGPGDTKGVGEDWHPNTPMMPEPPMGAILYALESPPYGGDTLFANQYLAYEALSDGMKRLLADLRAIHSDRLVAGPAVRLNERRSTKVREYDAWRETVSLHPVVRTHPETGRKCLFVNASLHRWLRGPDGGGEPPAPALPPRAGPPPGVHLPLCWTDGAVAFWDNRCVKTAIKDSGHSVGSCAGCRSRETSRSDLVRAACTIDRVLRVCRRPRPGRLRVDERPIEPTR